VAGCLVERYRDEIRKNMPEVDAVVGTGELEAIWPPPGWRAPAAPPDQPQLVSILPSRQPSSRPKAICASPRAASRASSGKARRRSFPSIFTTTPRRACWRRGKSSAYIKIAEGCDHPCSFCVIPNLRGKFRSRRFASVVAEAEQLVAQGVRELTLIGQDTTCYGEDLGMKDGLAQLLDSLARIPDLKWLRFLYAYPNKVTGRLLETIARHDNICKYLDMPLQHASGAGVEEHAPRRQCRHLSQDHRARALDGARCGDSEHVHHRLSRRNRGGLCRAQRLCPRRPARLAGGFQLLRRRGLRRLPPGR
jgi:ribosomal protein S12 methylthiotransferase